MLLLNQLLLECFSWLSKTLFWQKSGSISLIFSLIWLFRASQMQPRSLHWPHASPPEVLDGAELRTIWWACNLWNKPTFFPPQTAAFTWRPSLAKSNHHQGSSSGKRPDGRRCIFSTIDWLISGAGSPNFPPRNGEPDQSLCWKVLSTRPHEAHLLKTCLRARRRSSQSSLPNCHSGDQNSSHHPLWFRLMIARGKEMLSQKSATLFWLFFVLGSPLLLETVDAFRPLLVYSVLNFPANFRVSVENRRVNWWTDFFPGQVWASPTWSRPPLHWETVWFQTCCQTPFGDVLVQWNKRITCFLGAFRVQINST